MNLPILNRSGKLPEDGWHQIEVPGEHINHDAKVVQVIDDKAIGSILNRFQAAAKEPNFAGLLVDKDHFSLDTSKPSEAMGWALELRNRDGIPQARIDWTDSGRPLVEGKTYKFFSTVYAPQDVEQLGTRVVNGKSYRLVRPLALERLALTNDPNNKGGKPISNRDGNPASAATENQTEPTMKSLLKKLGLAEDASEESAVAALQVIQNRASQVEALTTERNTLLAAQAESDLEKYKNRFKAENREKIKAALIANRAATIELLDSIEAPIEMKKPITNRSAATPPADPGAKTDEIEKNAHAAKITNRAHEIQKTKSTKGRVYPWTSAFNEAASEFAEPAKK